MEEWGHVGCYNPVEDVTIYKGCEPCQPTAPCCQLAKPQLHVEHPTEHRGPRRVGEPVNHLCTRSNLPTCVYDTLSAMY